MSHSLRHRFANSLGVTTSEAFVATQKADHFDGLGRSRLNLATKTGLAHFVDAALELPHRPSSERQREA